MHTGSFTKVCLIVCFVGRRRQGNMVMETKMVRAKFSQKNDATDPTLSSHRDTARPDINTSGTARPRPIRVFPRVGVATGHYFMLGNLTRRNSGPRPLG
jgi:hypothetical protein